MTGAVPRLIAISLAGAVFCTLAATARAQRVGADAGLPFRANSIDAALARGVECLRKGLGPDGRCLSEFPESDRFYGGRTALTAYALATAGVRREDPALRRAMGWLARAKLRSVYSVSLRACALAAAGEANSLPLLRDDVRWLLAACSPQGQYTYEPLDGNAAVTFDNSNAHAAMVGVAAGASRGVEVPPDWWRRMERYWVDQQQFDGGWGYRTLPGIRQVKTYGSMTAAGLDSLLLCFDALRREDFAPCRDVPAYKPVEDGLAWLARAYQADGNPRVGENRYYYWLYSLSRVGQSVGYRYIGPHDWYAQAAAEVLPRQDASGGWGEPDPPTRDGPPGGPRADPADTAFAVMFLASGRHGLVANKLRYAGRWNARPRDLANFADWMSREFERPVSWQVVDANEGVEDLSEAPVLYISGAGPIDLTPAQLDRLRLYVQRGGMIVSEAACGNADFTLDMQRLLGRIFPHDPLQQLPADHRLYGAHFQVPAQAGLWGVFNGVRLLAVHSPRDLSLNLQLGPEPPAVSDSAALTAGAVERPAVGPVVRRTASFEMAANILFQATDKSPIPPRGERAWPAIPKTERPATLRLARLSHAGNCDPEPLAWERLAAALGSATLTPSAVEGRVRLEVSPLMSPADLDASKFPLAAMTGSADPNYTPDDLAAIRRYLQAGGTLVVDAAGGSRTFGQWVEKEVIPLLPGRTTDRVDLENELFRSPVKIDRVSYRRNYADALGPAASQPTLIGVQTDKGRLAILYSPDDLSCALVGYGGYNIRGYTPDSARKILTNLVCRVATGPTPPAATAPTTASGPAQSKPVP